MITSPVKQRVTEVPFHRQGELESIKSVVNIAKFYHLQFHYQTDKLRCLKSSTVKASCE